MWTIDQAAVELGIKGGLLRFWLEKLQIPTIPDLDASPLLDEMGLAKLKLVAEWREEGLSFDEIRAQFEEQNTADNFAPPAFIVPPAQPALRLAMEILHRHYERTVGQHDRVYRDLLTAHREISDLRYRLGKAEEELTQQQVPWWRRLFALGAARPVIATPAVLP